MAGSDSAQPAAHEHGSRGRLRDLVRPHSHDPADRVDAELEGSREGMRAVWVSLAALGATALLQAVVVVVTGSVALLSDTLHNAGDALTAVPLALAFWLGRRPPTRCYTYGFGRAEDLAGVVIVLLIAVSAALAAYESVRHLADARELRHLWAVAAAGVIGFCGNELVARYRIVVGRRIVSAALVADGLHARTDGFTSLAVVAGAAGVALGWRWADPVVGLAITVAILVVLRSAARDVYRRLMDAVDPALVATVEAELRATSGVRDIGSVRLRWIGHALRAEADVVLDADLRLQDAHAVTVDAEHRLLHAVPKLSAVQVHADPDVPDAPRGAAGARDPHELTRHHLRAPLGRERA